MSAKRLPIYKAEIIDDGTGMTAISLVDRPAVEKDFMALAAQAEPARFAVADADRQLIWGVVCRADFPIYRRDDTFGEYYLVFTADTIRQIAEQYLAEGRQNAVDLQHDGEMVEGVQLVQFVIKDTARGVVPAGFDDVADGSLFAEFHVTDPDIWDKVKAGDFNGFSLEGYFNYVPTPRTMAAAKQAPKSIIMNKLKQAFKALAAVVCRFGYIVTDKAIISWDGDEDLKAGDEVYIEGDDGSRDPIADGEYRTEDDKVIVVADGKVAEIRDEKAEVATEEPAEEPAPAEEISAARQKFNAIRAAFDLSYDDKYRKIYEALAAAGIVDCYILEAGDTFAIVSVWDGEGETLYRYPLTWDGDEVALGEREEVKYIAVPIDYEDPFTTEEVAAMQQTIEALTAKVERLSKVPAAPSAHEEVNSSTPKAEKLSRLQRILNA